MYELKPYNNIIIVTDEGKAVAINGKLSTGLYLLIAETAYLDFKLLKYCIRFTTPLKEEL